MTPQNKDNPYLDKLQEMPSQLVFIMGCHRSGTSMLHHLLAYTGKFNYINVYDIIEYPNLLYNRLNNEEQQAKQRIQDILSEFKNRGIDNLPVDADFPEEYRFILTELKFSMNIQERLKAKTMFSPHLTLKMRDKFVEMCRKKQFLHGEKQPLLLKNPNDFYSHFLDVHEMFPESKFIFIHRHPLEILNSFIINFEKVLINKNKYWELLDPGYNRLFNSPIKRFFAQRAFRSNFYMNIVISRLSAGLRYYVQNISQLPKSSYLSFKYEDICSAPDDCIVEIMQWLGLEHTSQIPKQFVLPRELKIREQIQRNFVKRLEDFRPYMEQLGYS